MKNNFTLWAAGGILCAAFLVSGVFWFLYPGSGSLPTETPLPDLSVRIFPATGGGPTSAGRENGNQESLLVETPSVYRVSEKPVSGYTLLKKDGGWVTRYVDRETGNLYEASLEHPSNIRLTNTTLPGMEEAMFTSSSTLLLRAEERGVVKTLYASVGTSSAQDLAPLSLQALPEDILSLSVNGQNIFYLREDPEGGVAGFLANIPAKTSAKIFSHPFSEWNLRLLSASRAFLEHKPSAYSQGGLFMLNLQSGALTPVLLGKVALSGVPDASGKNIIYSELGTGEPQISLLDTEKNKTTFLPLPTLAEKCAWGQASSTYAFCLVPKIGGPAGIYPDDWYSGESSFEDTLWKIDTKTGTPTLLQKLSEEALDGINLSLATDDSYAVFIDKKTLSLWSVRLKP